MPREGCPFQRKVVTPLGHPHPLHSSCKGQCADPWEPGWAEGWERRQSCRANGQGQGEWQGRRGLKWVG